MRLQCRDGQVDQDTPESFDERNHNPARRPQYTGVLIFFQFT